MFSLILIASLYLLASSTDGVLPYEADETDVLVVHLAQVRTHHIYRGPSEHHVPTKGPAIYPIYGHWQLAVFPHKEFIGDAFHIDIETMDGTRVSQFHYGSRLTWSDYAPLGGGYYFPLSEINSKLEIGQEYRVVLRLYARASALKQNFGQIPKPEFNDILYRSILPENVNWLRLVSLQLTDGQLKVHEKILRDASPVIGHQFDEFPEDEMIDMRDFTISVGQMLIQILYYGKLKEEYPRHYLAEQLRSVYILASRYDMHRVMVTALNEFTNIHPDKQSAIKMMTTLGEHRSEIGDKYLDCVMDVKWNFGACPLKLGDKSPGHVSSGKDHFSWLFRKIRN